MLTLNGLPLYILGLSLLRSILYIHICPLAALSSLVYHTFTSLDLFAASTAAAYHDQRQLLGLPTQCTCNTYLCRVNLLSSALHSRQACHKHLCPSIGNWDCCGLLWPSEPGATILGISGPAFSRLLDAESTHAMHPSPLLSLAFRCPFTAKAAVAVKLLLFLSLPPHAPGQA